MAVALSLLALAGRGVEWVCRAITEAAPGDAGTRPVEGVRARSSRTGWSSASSPWGARASPCRGGPRVLQADERCRAAGQADGLIAVKWDGPAKGRGLFPGVAVQAVAAPSR